MPSAGLQIFASGLRLQAVTPGVTDQGNANLSGVMLAGQFSTADTIGVETAPEIFGHGHTPGTGINNVILGAYGTVGNQGLAVAIGYQVAVYYQTSVAMGFACQAGFSGGGNSDAVAIGKDCNASTAAASTGRCVAMGYAATARGNNTVAVGSEVTSGTTNTNGALSVCFGKTVTIDNSGHRDVMAIGSNIIETVSARQNVTVIGMYDSLGPAGAYPGVPGDNTILLGNPAQTTVRVGAYWLTGGSVSAAFRQTANVTVANTVTETTLAGAGSGSLTIPANRLSAGSTIRITARGTVADTGTPTLQIRVKLGSTTFLDFGAVTFPTLAGTHGWVLEGEITIRTAGAGGTAIANGMVWVSVTGSPDIDTTNTGTTALDTTAAQTLNLTAQWGTASPSNTITCTHLTMEVLG